eukprot:bmy_18172T0
MSSWMGFERLDADGNVGLFAEGETHRALSLEHPGGGPEALQTKVVLGEVKDHLFSRIAIGNQSVSQLRVRLSAVGTLSPRLKGQKKIKKQDMDSICRLFPPAVIGQGPSKIYHISPGGLIHIGGWNSHLENPNLGDPPPAQLSLSSRPLPACPHQRGRSSCVLQHPGTLSSTQ